MSTRVHAVLGATAIAVALAACTASAPATSAPRGATAVDDSRTGLVLDVPDGFDLDHGDGRETSWLGPPGADGTRVGITTERACEQPRPTWQDVVDAVERGEHAEWDDHTPTTRPVTVRVDGATAALRARGTFTLPVAATGERVELVDDQLLLRDPAGTVHRVQVMGAADAVAALDLDALFDSVAVAEPGCPS